MVDAFLIFFKNNYSITAKRTLTQARHQMATVATAYGRPKEIYLNINYILILFITMIRKLSDYWGPEAQYIRHSPG